MPPSGLFDFQVNGFGGVDFQRDGLTRAQFDHAIAALRQHRTAGLFVTLITDDLDARERGRDVRAQGSWARRAVHVSGL
jgi:N-acetylglucosamine-6-phosphate deacetylase